MSFTYNQAIELNRVMKVELLQYMHQVSEVSSNNQQQILNKMYFIVQLVRSIVVALVCLFIYLIIHNNEALLNNLFK